MDNLERIKTLADIISKRKTLHQPEVLELCALVKGLEPLEENEIPEFLKIVANDGFLSV